MKLLRSASGPRVPPGCFLLPLLVLLPCASAATGSTTQTLTATIQPAAKLSVPAAVNMTTTGGKFSSFQASLAIRYRVRTSVTGGGSLTVQVTSDFSPSGGPSAGAGALLYSCSGTTLGTPCMGTQVAGTHAQTPVVAIPAGVCTGGGGACSSADPNGVTINFSLADDPDYPTAAYSAQLTFVISAT